MKVNDTVFLKSGSPQLVVEWLVGITQKPGLSFDPNVILMNRPNYQPGDVAVIWDAKNRDMQETYPAVSVIKHLDNRQPATQSNLTLGCVVKCKQSQALMTVVWIVGTPKAPSATFDANEFYKHTGQFKDGDVVCGWFEKHHYVNQTFKKEEVIKLFD